MLRCKGEAAEVELVIEVLIKVSNDTRCEPSPVYCCVLQHRTINSFKFLLSPGVRPSISPQRFPTIFRHSAKLHDALGAETLSFPSFFLQDQ